MDPLVTFQIVVSVLRTILISATSPRVQSKVNPQSSDYIGHTCAADPVPVVLDRS